jgi:hypothetical protein
VLARGGAQRGGQRVGRIEAIPRVLGHRLQNNPFDVLG